MSLLWGSGWMAAPALAEVAAPFAAAALLFAIAASGLFLVSLQKQAERLPWRIHFTLGLALFAGPTALLVVAGQHGIGGWIPLLYALLPLLAAGERWSPAMAIAPGAVLLLLNGTVPFAPGKLVWALPALVAVGLQAWALRYAARHLAGCSVARNLAPPCALAAALLVIGSLVLDPSPRIAPAAQWTSGSVGSLVLLSILGTALPYAGLYALLAGEAYRPEQAAVAEWLQTLVMVGESAVLARAHPSWALAGAAVLLLGCCRAVLQPQSADDEALTFLSRDGN